VARRNELGPQCHNEKKQIVIPAIPWYFIVHKLLSSPIERYLSRTVNRVRPQSEQINRDLSIGDRPWKPAAIAYRGT